MAGLSAGKYVILGILAALPWGTARPGLVLLAANLGVEEAHWIVTGLGAIAFLIGIAVGIKKLREPARPEVQKTFLSNVPVEVRAAVVYVEEPTFKAFEKYVHEKHHLLASQLQHLELAAEERRLESANQAAEVMKELHLLGERLDGKRSASVGNLHEQLKDAELRIAAVSKEAEVHTQQLNAIDQKLTNILQRLPRSK